MLQNYRSQFLSPGGEGYEEIPDHYFFVGALSRQDIASKNKQHIVALAPVISFLMTICLREGERNGKGDP